MRTVHQGTGLDTEQINENLRQFFSACQGLVSLLGIDVESFLSQSASLMPDLIGQVLCRIATGAVSFQACPETIRLLGESEEPTDLLKLLPEQLLLRWLNHHLANAGQLRVNNLGNNLRHCKPLIHLLNQLDSSKCSLDGLEEADDMRRAEIVVNSAYALGCGDIASSKDLVAGNAKVNTLFLAILFSAKHGLEVLTFKESLITHMLEDDI